MFFKIQARNHKYWDDIKAWREEKNAYEMAKLHGMEGDALPPGPDAEERLLAGIRLTQTEMDEMKRLASDLGQDPGKRTMLVQMALVQIGAEQDWADVSQKEFKEEV